MSYPGILATIRKVAEGGLGTSVSAREQILFSPEEILAVFVNCPLSAQLIRELWSSTVLRLAAVGRPFTPLGTMKVLEEIR